MVVVVGGVAERDRDEGLEEVELVVLWREGWNDGCCGTAAATDDDDAEADDEDETIPFEDAEAAASRLCKVCSEFARRGF